MGISDEPLIVTGNLLMGRGRMIGSLRNDREYLLWGSRSRTKG